MSDLDLEQLIATAPMGKEIWRECVDLAELLLRKNISYGNSALEYESIFGNLTAEQALYARLNDKLARIKNNLSYEDEGMTDAVRDTAGYLMLLLILYRGKDV
jgi:hypothetical protein